MTIGSLTMMTTFSENAQQQNVKENKHKMRECNETALQT